MEYDNKAGTQKTTYTFKGWKSATEKYNGGGVKGYVDYVWKMYENARKAEPKDY